MLLYRSMFAGAADHSTAPVLRPRRTVRVANLSLDVIQRRNGLSRVVGQTAELRFR